MEMLNKCLDISPQERIKMERFDRASQEEFNQRNEQRKEIIAACKESRSSNFGNRKARRREAALQRQNKELV